MGDTFLDSFSTEFSGLAVVMLNKLVIANHGKKKGGLELGAQT